MTFSSIFFLFFFLPAVLLVYAVTGRSFRNLTLLLFSLVFYAWGEGIYVTLMLGSVVVNYIFGLLIARSATTRSRKVFLTFVILINLIPLVYFKYSEFFLDGIYQVLPFAAGENSYSTRFLHLPIGISFFTFQAMSYVIDVFRKVTPPQKNILDMGLYIAFFPQLIAGPIVRYHDFAGQIKKRVVSIHHCASGIERFVFGLSKKVLLANPLGAVADLVFGLGGDFLTTPTAWMGILCYTLQIYFDFSGYSDMAIGLGRMFGFRFPENFNYPYVSRSIREFWRRWHISLSSWFKDYLYIPLGGSRRGSLWTAFNLVLVFFLCGLWHGANWTFVVWGGLHGLFIVLERGTFGVWLRSSFRLVRHFYALMVICITWVFFRADTIGDAMQFLGVMFRLRFDEAVYPLVAIQLDAHFSWTLIAACLLSMPIYPLLKKNIQRSSRISTAGILSVIYHFGHTPIRLCKIGGLLLASSMSLAAGSYNPFIYFRF
jgi:alginate O-acetyltransferase complex protein AlgI